MMKKLISLCLPIFFYLQLGAQQPCDNSLAYIGLQANNISTIIHGGGRLFNQNGSGFFHYGPAGGSLAPSTMYSANLWVGGLDPASNLHLFVADYGNTWPAGPLNANGVVDPGDCFNWDRLFRVGGDEIKSFLQDLPALAGDPGSAVTLYPGVMGWPGRGNPHFTSVWGFALSLQPLAPFFDSDQDGIYNPLAGDYPAVVLQNKPPFVPAEIIWSVYNDQVADPNNLRVKLEVRQTAWAFNCADQPQLNNTVFTSQKITYRGDFPMDSVFIGMWSDIDLGCYSDDYIGCEPALDAYYGYNQDPVDGSPGADCSGGVATFADHPPVQSVTFLNRSMDRFITYNNGGSMAWSNGPNSPAEYYNYLSGSWRDGAPITFGGFGHDPVSPDAPLTNYAFSDDPADPDGWSMCTAGYAQTDRQALGIVDAGTLQPGQVEELTLAWSVHPNPDLPCGLGTTFSDIAVLHSLFDDNFATVCSPLTTATEAASGSFELFPNPATQSFTLRYDAQAPREIRLFTADGRLALVEKNLQPGQTTVDVSRLPSGCYHVRLLTAAGAFTRKLCIVR